MVYTLGDPELNAIIISMKTEEEQQTGQIFPWCRLLFVVKSVIF